jgi:hypothetical protein
MADPIGTVVPAQATQVSANGYQPITGTTIDLSPTNHNAYSFQVKETGGVNGITVKVQGSNDNTNWNDIISCLSDDPAFTYAVAVAVAASGLKTLYPNMQFGCSFRYVRMAVTDTVGNSHGTAQVNMFAH